MPGIKKLLPESFRKHAMFDNIYNLECVPIATVQARLNGGVTEMTLTLTLTPHPNPTPQPQPGALQRLGH